MSVSRIHVLASVWLTCAVVPAAAQVKYGDWYYLTDTDGMTDEVSHQIVTPETSTDTRNPLLNVAGMVAMGLLCSQNETVAVAILSTQLYFPANPIVQYRFDSRPASAPREWETPPGASGARLPQNLMQPFIENAKSGRLLRVRVTDSITQEDKDYTFSLLGFTTAFDRAPCAERDSLFDPLHKYPSRGDHVPHRR